MTLTIESRWWGSSSLPEKDAFEAIFLRPAEAIFTQHRAAGRIQLKEVDCPHPWALHYTGYIDWTGPFSGVSGSIVIRVESSFGKVDRVSIRDAFHRTSPLIGVALTDLVDEVNVKLMMARREAEEPQAKPARQTPEAPEPSPGASQKQDLISAMRSLGYSKSEATTRANQALEKAEPNASLQDLIVLALKKEN